jgi:hypothetical protein
VQYPGPGADEIGVREIIKARSFVQAAPPWFEIRSDILIFLKNNFNQKFDFCREKKYFRGMQNKAAAPAGEIQHPDALALRHMFGKNHWLIRIRWIYPAFIVAFFLAYLFLARRSLITPLDALLVFLLPVIVIFSSDERTAERSDSRQHDELARMVSPAQIRPGARWPDRLFPAAAFTSSP